MFAPEQLTVPLPLLAPSASLKLPFISAPFHHFVLFLPNTDKRGPADPPVDPPKKFEVCRQSQDRQADRSDNPAERVGESRQGHKIAGSMELGANSRKCLGGTHEKKLLWLCA
jgi:hypothetical protein